MQRDPQRTQFLQGLRGAQPIVILTYLLVRCGMTIAQLQQQTGLSYDFISPAVQALEGKGMLVKQVGQHGKHVYLPSADSFFAQLSSESLFLESQNPLAADSGKSIGDQPSLHFKLKRDIQEPELTEAKTANLAAFKELEIFGKRPRQIASLPWVNPDYIRAHVLYARSLTWPDNPDGYALGQMTEQVPAPAAPEPKQQYFQDRIIPGGRGKADTVIHYTFDLDQVTADFTGHRKGCSCDDCAMLRASNGDTRIMCADCKHFHCDCEEPDEE